MLNRNNDHLCLLYLQSNICKRSVVCVQESMWEGTKDCVYLLAKACFFCAYMRMFCLCSFVCLVIHVVPSEVYCLVPTPIPAHLLLRVKRLRFTQNVVSHMVD